MAGSAKENAEKTEVPDVEGSVEATAEKDITAANLTPVKEYEYNSTVEAGNVISQTPSAGTTVSEGTNVTIVISRGKQSTEVPTVVGFTKEEAESKIKEKGLVASVTEVYDDSVPEGEVISQEISGGKTVEMGTKIPITVSKGSQNKYYTCDATIPIKDGTTHIDIQLLGSDGGELWSETNLAISNTTARVKKEHIAGVSSGTIKVVYYQEVTVASEGVESTENEGATAGTTTTELKKIGSNSFAVNFTEE